jgi:hypothetical protein
MTITLSTNQQFSAFIKVNRKNVTNINGVEFNEIYPMIEATSKHATYYDVESQGNKFLNAPFVIQVKPF